jgi:hypothetical protein
MGNKVLPYESSTHKDVLEALRKRVKLGVDHMAKLAPKFEDAERRHIVYMPESEHDRIRKDARKSSGAQSFVTLDIPYSYAMMLSAHTYWCSVFMGRDPVLQYAGRHGEGEMSIQALEAIMNYQVMVGRMIAPWYVWLHDTGKYGMGILWNYWEEEEITSAEIVEEPQTYLGIVIPGKFKKKKVTKTHQGFVGNKVFNVKPQDFIPDPRVPFSQLQQGEFVGRHIGSVSWNALVKGKLSGKYYNIDVLERISKGGAQQSDDISRGISQVELPENQPRSMPGGKISDPGNFDLIEICVELIPRSWGLGEGERPEKWLFTIANKRVIIESRPAGYLHGKFPAFLLQYEVDGYSIDPRGMYEVLAPLNDSMSWLLNTHFYNVRSTLNNQFVFDPSMLIAKDLSDSGAGKLIRARPEAYGQDLRKSIIQLPVQDVTQGHMRDMNVIGDMMQRVAGVTDNIMGMVNAGGRKTATEVRTSSSFGINRLKTSAEFWSAGDWSLMAQVMVQNTQQFYDGERKFKIAGSLMEDVGEGFLNVSPEMISGFFDYVPVDGTMPIDRYAQANLWREILMGMKTMPEVAQQYNTAGIFGWMAQLAGLKNIKQFRLNVVPDGMAADQARAGNSVPMGGQGGGANSGGAAGSGGVVPGAGQISGMGPSG